MMGRVAPLPLRCWLQLVGLALAATLLLSAVFIVADSGARAPRWFLVAAAAIFGTQLAFIILVPHWKKRRLHEKERRRTS